MNPNAIREIPDAPGYFASRDGRIYSLRAGRWGKNTELLELATIMDGHGYKKVGIYTSDGHIRKHVHQLVLLAFIGPRPVGMVSCHGPLGREVNSVENLSYGTQRKNNGIDRVRDGTSNRGERHGMAKLNDLKVRVIRRLRGELPARHLANIFGVCDTQIYSIWGGRAWKNSHLA